MLVLRGPDAVAFAHAQFASDLRELATGAWQWSAWLSAQGRARALFRLLRVGGDELHVVLSGGTAEELRRQLAPFVFRSKVSFEVVSASAIGCFGETEAQALLGALPGADDVVQARGRIGVRVGATVPRWLVLGEANDAPPADPAALDRWRAADIEAGIVELDPTLQDRFLPAALGLERLGAVGVRKGCYPGQEIVARLYFKGGNKRWLHRLEFVADQLPVPGMALAGSDGLTVGEVLQAAWTALPKGIALAALPELAPGVALAGASTVVADFRVVSAIRIASD